MVRTPDCITSGVITRVHDWAGVAGSFMGAGAVAATVVQGRARAMDHSIILFSDVSVRDDLVASLVITVFGIEG